MSLAAAARSPLASPALKHALNGGACYFTMAGASHLGVATSPGGPRSPHASTTQLGSPHAHLGSPHFGTAAAAATSPGQMHLALPAGPPTGFTLRLPQRGADASPDGFTLRLPAEKRMTPRSPGMPPRARGAAQTMSPRAAAMSPRAAAMSPRTVGTPSAAADVRSQDISQLQALADAPAKVFTLTLPAPRRQRRVNVNVDALEDATPAVAAKIARKETAKVKTSGGGGGGSGGFVGFVKRTVRFVLPAPAPPKGASEFRSCRGRPPTPYPKEKQGGRTADSVESEAADYFSVQV